MEKYLEKTYIVEEEHIIISLYDTRDSYLHENTLGDVGSIHISPYGVFICPGFENDMNLEKIKEKKLVSAFKEIFGTEEYDPLSPEYYEKIKTMIENGTLKSLGYKIIVYTNDTVIPQRKKKH